MILVTPIHASQLIRPSVRILEKPNPIIAATATKMAVQVACIERAFKAIEILSIAEPEVKVKTMGAKISDLILIPITRYRALTEAEAGTENFTANPAKHQLSRIINAVDFGMAELESTDNEVGPSSDAANYADKNNTGNYPHGVEDRGDG